MCFLNQIYGDVDGERPWHVAYRERRLVTAWYNIKVLNSED